ncbi:AAA family ATPase [Actinobacillus pleuropneumoniae]|uniref:ATP-dependent nuclease n=1 Tax=Actinobacillus pleuropneumoniae TaxID=715 RepID=UPI002E9B359E|nr:AAA family ATPase [Actinobacillus pleuropneumoniae]
MITNLDIDHYRKLRNITLSFTPGINLISGTNGTCKSSILHIISNSFQGVNSDDEGLRECLSIITRINQSINPKINNLTKGDNRYNDPAPGKKGELYKVQYNNGSILGFRRHNARSTSRFSLKPKYATPGESLPESPVIYLGLTRLIPIGELMDVYANIRKSLPEDYQNEIIQKYNELTGIPIKNISTHEITGLKRRGEFETDLEGIDSNTISVGEDNLFVILNALYSAKYYSSVTNKRPSIILIDEIDAGLHPSLQFRLLNLLREFSRNFNIQIIFTTHSLYLIDKALKNRDNIIYLMKSANNSVSLMQNPDIFKIEMHLNSETRQDLYKDKKLPIFSEDDEARIMINIIFDTLSENDQQFASIRHYFHLVQMKSGCQNLKTLFKDRVLTANTLKAICILDGDSRTHELKHNIISLPGQNSPEKITFQHLDKLLSNKSYNDFWCNEYIQQEGYSFEWANDNIHPQSSALVSSYDRENAKKLFTDINYHPFFTIVLKDWILRNWDSKEMKEFIKDLNILFHNLSDYYGIHSARWPRF